MAMSESLAFVGSGSCEITSFFAIFGSGLLISSSSFESFGDGSFCVVAAGVDEDASMESQPVPPGLAGNVHEFGSSSPGGRTVALALAANVPAKIRCRADTRIVEP